MTNKELAASAEQLRERGFEARSLGAAGIVIWFAGEGYFFPTAQLTQFSRGLAVDWLEKSLEERRRTTEVLP